jgi:hypothetical protein
VRIGLGREQLQTFFREFADSDSIPPRYLATACSKKLSKFVRIRIFRMRFEIGLERFDGEVGAFDTEVEHCERAELVDMKCGKPQLDPDRGGIIVVPEVDRGEIAKEPRHNLLGSARAELFRSEHDATAEELLQAAFATGPVDQVSFVERVDEHDILVSASA